jgi:small GTP-binding protein
MAFGPIYLKIVILGRSFVGKTSVISRYCNNEFSDLTVPTLGAGVTMHSLTLSDREVSVSLWDTAGSERFRTLTPAFWRGADGLVLVYDVGDNQSFLDLENDFNPFFQNTSVPTVAPLPVLLLGNKIDRKDRAVTRSAVRAWMANKGITMSHEVSAKTGENLKEAFAQLVGLLVNNAGHQTMPRLRLRESPPEERWCC